MNNDKYTMVEQLTPDQIVQLHELCKQMWWSKDRTREEINIMLETCMVFAVIDKKTNELVGFARVLTDRMRYAYIYDVMVQDYLRGKGVGKIIMQAILSNYKLKNIRYIELTCTQDMISYYYQLGFTCNFSNVIPMRYINRPNT